MHSRVHLGRRRSPVGSSRPVEGGRRRSTRDFYSNDGSDRSRSPSPHDAPAAGRGGSRSPSPSLSPALRRRGSVGGDDTRRSSPDSKRTRHHSPSPPPPSSRHRDSSANRSDDDIVGGFDDQLSPRGRGRHNRRTGRSPPLAPSAAAVRDRSLSRSPPPRAHGDPAEVSRRGKPRPSAGGSRRPLRDAASSGSDHSPVRHHGRGHAAEEGETAGRRSRSRPPAEEGPRRSGRFDIEPSNHQSGRSAATAGQAYHRHNRSPSRGGPGYNDRRPISGAPSRGSGTEGVTARGAEAAERHRHRSPVGTGDRRYHQRGRSESPLPRSSGGSYPTRRADGSDRSRRFDGPATGGYSATQSAGRRRGSPLPVHSAAGVSGDRKRPREFSADRETEAPPARRPRWATTERRAGGLGDGETTIIQRPPIQRGSRGSREDRRSSTRGGSGGREGGFGTGQNGINRAKTCPLLLRMFVKGDAVMPPPEDEDAAAVAERKKDDGDEKATAAADDAVSPSASNAGPPAPSQEVEEEMQVYLWRDITLREIVNLAKDLMAEVRQPGIRMHLKLRKQDGTEVNLGVLNSQFQSTQDRLTLASFGFQIGDCIAAEINKEPVRRPPIEMMNSPKPLPGLDVEAYIMKHLDETPAPATPEPPAAVNTATAA